MSVKSFIQLGGVNLKVGEHLGGYASSGAQSPTIPGSIAVGETMRSVSTAKLQALGAFGTTYTGAGVTNISLAKVFGEGQYPYVKSTTSVNTTLGITGTNTLNGALNHGTNGDYDATVVGRDSSGNWYYTVGMHSAAWRPGVNLYKIPADGSSITRIYSHHHIGDAIHDQGTLCIPLSSTLSVNSGYLAIMTRWSDQGKPMVFITDWSSSGSVTGSQSNFLPKNYLTGGDAWGQPLDGINIPNTSPGYTTGIMLWQRQWWGPRLLCFKRNNASGIQNQTAISMQLFYHDYTVDHQFSGVGGITFSPVTNKIYLIYSYRPEERSDAGRNLGMLSCVIGNINGSGAITEGAKEYDWIHYQWGGGCNEDWGNYTASHVCYLGNNGNDILAYAFIQVESESLYFRVCQNTNQSEGRCQYEESFEENIGGVNPWQRVRVRRLGVSRIHDDGGNLVETYYNVALSWVDSSQQTRVKTYKVKHSNLATTELGDYSPSGNFRGTVGFNGTVENTSEEPQYNMIIGTDNAGLQTTYTWASGKSYNPGYDQDRSRVLRLV